MTQQSNNGLKLVQWVNDGYPPIDLNKQVTHVNQLVNAYNKLRENNSILAEALGNLIKANMAGEAQGANWIYAKEALNRIS